MDDSSSTPALSNPPSVATLSSGLVRPVSQVRLISDINRDMADQAAHLVLLSNKAVKNVMPERMSRNGIGASHTAPFERKKGVG